MAISIFPRGAKPERFLLKATDVLMVTNDTRTGPALTTNRALCYVWPTPAEAESQRHAYEAALGVALTVERQEVNEC